MRQAMSALSLLGSFSGGQGGLGFGSGPSSTRGGNSSFGDFGGLTFNGGSSGGSSGLSTPVLIGGAAVLGAVLFVALKK